MLVWNSVIIRKALIMVAWTNLCISFHCGCNPHFQRNLNRLTNTPLRSVNIHHETKVVNEGEVKTEVDSDNTESWSQTMSVLFEPTPFTADGVVQLCDRIEESDTSYRVNAILRHKRRKALLSILQRDRDEYITIVSFLGARIPRDELPNAQGVPYPVVDAPLKEHILTKEDVDTNVLTDDVLGGLNKTIPLIADCNLQPMQYRDSVLDRFLLARFRGLVQKEVGFISNTKGIRGLLEEGKHMLMSPHGQVNNYRSQHTYVKKVLDQMLPPMLPALFRIFMSGIIPPLRGVPQRTKRFPAPAVAARQIEAEQQVLAQETSANGEKSSGGRETISAAVGRNMLGTQWGPWFFAPYLTSVVSPLFLTFLIGPCRPNRRKDGQRGGMMVEKCKFLQESNCKGLCLHQCKLPAEQYFVDTLGLPLAVTPNFETQECQWSWGEHPMPYYEDKEFPKGCIKSCGSRQALHSTHN